MLSHTLRYFRLSSVLLLVGCLFYGLVQGQQKVVDDTVFVDVSVVDKTSKPFAQLTKEHFKILEKDVPLEITFFDSAEKHLSIAFVFDFSGSVSIKRRNAFVRAAQNIVEGGNRLSDYRITLFSNSARIYCAIGCSGTDVTIALNAVDQTVVGRNTALYDACLTTMENLEASANGRRAMVVFSDGQDNASRATFNKLREALKRSSVSMYSLTVLNGSDAESSLGIEGEGILDELAGITGGRAYFVREKEVTEFADLIASQLRQEYTLGFKPIAKTIDPKKPHRIKIKLLLPEPKNLPTLYLRYRDYYFSRYIPVNHQP